MLKNLFVAAVVASLPMAASAATITGQIDFAGVIDFDNSDFTAGGSVDVVNESATAIFATGDLASAMGMTGTFGDVDFAAPGVIWSVGDFTFTATSFTDIMSGSPSGFLAYGVLSGGTFDATDGVLSFSANPLMNRQIISFSSTTTPVPVPAGLLLLGTALAGFGLVGRKRA